MPNSKSEKEICKSCNGTGLSGDDIKICPNGLCTKCEFNEGFLVHPLDECSKCGGLGSIKSLHIVCNIK